MEYTKTFQDLQLDNLVATAERLKREGWRCVQMLCTNTEDGIDMTYSFALENTLANYQVRGVREDTKVPSIQEHFLNIFPFENEAKDLFGVDVDGMVLDFAGQFYAVAEKEPMTILTPEAKERKDKEAKKAAAAAAKAAKAAQADKGDTLQSGAGQKSCEADIEAKLAGMDPEKAAKVRAAIKAKAAKEKASAPSVTPENIDEKIAGLDPEKAAKVRAALEAKQQREAAGKGDE